MSRLAKEDILRTISHTISSVNKNEFSHIFDLIEKYQAGSANVTAYADNTDWETSLTEQEWKDIRNKIYKNIDERKESASSRLFYNRLQKNPEREKINAEYFAYVSRGVCTWGPNCAAYYSGLTIEPDGKIHGCPRWHDDLIFSQYNWKNRLKKRLSCNDTCQKFIKSDNIRSENTRFIMERKKIGRVTQQERDALKTLFKKKNELIGLAESLDGLKKEELENSYFYEKITKDFGQASLILEEWWDKMNHKYNWESIHGSAWEIDFETGDIFLLKQQLF